MKAIILLASAVSLGLFSASNDKPADAALAKCLEQHAFDVCHYTLYR